MRNAGLYYLQRHPASVAHFITVMQRKMQRSLRCHPDQDLAPFEIFIREVLVPDFARMGFLDDTLYASGLTHSLARKGLPKGEIKRRLKVKGIGGDYIDETGLLEGHDDLAAAVTFIRRKRLGAYATRARDPQKDLAALARNGFSYDVASRALRMPRDEAEAFMDETFQGAHSQI